MLRVVLLAGLMAVFLLTSSTAIRAGETVFFDRASFPERPEKLRLKGRLAKPDGAGPFAAVVLMHGCGGVWRWNAAWEDRLKGWGYVVLDVDSLAPRGFGSICDHPGSLRGEDRALDAHGAKSYLMRQPFVDGNRIAVIGMSHGGWAVLHALRTWIRFRLDLPPFKAGIALYPWCDDASKLDAPLLIAIGELDNWTPAERCRRYVAGAATSHELILKTYPDAHHVFDLKDTWEVMGPYTLRYKADAAADAIERIRAFLAKHL